MTEKKGNKYTKADFEKMVNCESCGFWPEIVESTSTCIYDNDLVSTDSRPHIRLRCWNCNNDIKTESYGNLDAAIDEWNTMNEKEEEN